MRMTPLLLLLLLLSLLLTVGCLGDPADDDDSSATGDDDDDSTAAGDDDDSAAAGDDDDSAAVGDDDDSAVAGDDDDSAVAGDDDDSAVAGDDDDTSGEPALTCPENDMYEDNDSMSAAHDLGALPMGLTTVEGILCGALQAPDTDWFSFSSAATIAICYDLVVTSNAGQGVGVERTNNAGNSQATGDTSPSSPVEMLNVNVPVTSHKVGLTRAGNTTALPRRYTLDITMKAAANCF